MKLESDRSPYQPVDLTSWCTAGTEVFDLTTYKSGGTWLQPLGGAEPKVGLCELRGIPFQIGPPTFDAGARRYLDFRAPAAQPIHIPINDAAINVIFAHTLLATDMWLRGDAPGTVVANYVFEYVDGTEVAVPIRERFEIGHFPQPWGHSPFLALPDNYEAVEAPRAGSWDRVGYRLTEVGMPMTKAYHLWSWRNPHSEIALEAVRIVPITDRFVVAGMTLGLVDEEPLRLPPRLPVLIADIGRDEAIEMTVDRGVATSFHPTAPPPIEETPGWGRSGSQDLYGFVAAVPSASLTINRGGEELGSVPWRELQAGAASLGAARIEIASSGLNWVHVTVTDNTGHPVPCRVSFTSDKGIPFPPHGHHAPVQAGLGAWNLDIGGDVLLGDVSYAYIDGRCQGWLPRGRLTAEITRGFEYEPIALDVEIQPGQRSLELTIDRWADMNGEGWYSGDTHVHFLSPDGALTEAAAEGLNAVNLLQAQWGHLFTNVEDFTGRTRSSEDGLTVVHVSQENRQHVLGHLNLLGLRHPVMPMSSDGPSEAELGGGLDITTSRWADAAHDQGATVIVAHMPTPNGENAVLVATHRADGLEMIDFNHFEHLEYYRYLNGGYRLPLVAGTDKMEASIPVGEYRTYARLDEEFSLDSWLAAVRAGRTFATSGPLISFTVDGAHPGTVLERPVGAKVTIEAKARSIFPIHVLQVVQGGHVVAETGNERGTRELRLEAEVPVGPDGWLAARCAGPGYAPGTRHHDHDRRPVMAHTSPVYVDTGTKRPQQADTDHYLLSLVHGGLEYLRSAQHHPHGSVTYHHGREDHAAYLEEPFLEAQAALTARITAWETV